MSGAEEQKANDEPQEIDVDNPCRPRVNLQQKFNLNSLSQFTG